MYLPQSDWKHKKWAIKTHVWCVILKFRGRVQKNLCFTQDPVVSPKTTQVAVDGNRVAGGRSCSLLAPTSSCFSDCRREKQVGRRKRRLQRVWLARCETGKKTGGVLPFSHRKQPTKHLRWGVFASIWWQKERRKTEDCFLAEFSTKGLEFCIAEGLWGSVRNSVWAILSTPFVLIFIIWVLLCLLIKAMQPTLHI